jgi:hypothetical protein
MLEILFDNLPGVLISLQHEVDSLPPEANA